VSEDWNIPIPAPAFQQCVSDAVRDATERALETLRGSPELQEVILDKRRRKDRRRNCGGINVDGTHCTRQARPGEDYCNRHLQKGDADE
jgi:hypothetical protein